MFPDQKIIKIGSNGALCSLQPISLKQLKEVRRIHSILFPVFYSNKYFREILDNDLCRLIRLEIKQNCPASDCMITQSRDTTLTERNGKIIGILCSSASNDLQILSENSKNVSEQGKALYVMTLGVLAPYRELGLGTWLLSYAEEAALNHGLQQVCLHVQSNNERAISWYQRKGFVKLIKLLHYYKKLKPDSAYLLAKNINYLDEHN